MAGRRKQALAKLRSRSSRQTVESPRRASSRGRALRKQALAREREALEQQAATADILRALSKSNTNPQPVFEAIVEHAHRLTGALYSVLYRYDGRQITIAADRHVSRAASRAQRASYPRAPSRDYMVGRTILEGRTYQSADLPNDPRFPGSRHAISKYFSRRALMTVPLLRDGVVIGAIGTGRAEAKAFTKSETKLLETFAAEAVIAIEKVRLFNETKEALERQTATSEILRVISSSPANLQPVFDTIARNFIALCGAALGSVYTYDGRLVHHAGGAGLRTPEQRRAHRAKYPVRVDDPSVVSARTIRARAPVHVEDALADAHYDPERVRSLGVRRILGVPMLREGEPLGALVAGWYEAGPTPKQHEELLRTFADQAAIAIENVRLFNETKEALERQTATADILRVISSSTTDIQPVFDAIAKAAVRLIGGFSAGVTRVIDDRVHLAAFTSSNPSGDEALKATFPRPVSEGLIGEAIRGRLPVLSADLETEPSVAPNVREAARARGYRAVIVVPMIREGVAIGTLTVTRREPGPFTDHQVRQLQTFADQAVIAIENVRLFNETKEALEQQTAIADILSVISSSPTDIHPVLQTVAEAAARLCRASDVFIRLVQGELMPTVIHVGEIPLPDETKRQRILPTTAPGHAILECKSIHIPDTAAPEVRARYPDALFQHQTDHFRSLLCVPLVRKGHAIGTITIRRPELGPFPESQIKLLQTFADQAVIAIENVRLFNETKEALERQTATAEILRVMSSSPSDVQPVFDLVARKTSELCNGNHAVVVRFDGELIHLAAQHNARPGAGQPTAHRYPRPPGRETPSSRAVLERTVIHVPYADKVPEFSQVSRQIGAGSFLSVPLLREGTVIGAIGASRAESGPFPEKQIELVKVFADQAVIAIENVRLFKELQDRTEALTKSVDQLTALGEVGQAISSTLDLDKVLKTIVSRAVQLTGLDAGGIYEYDEASEQFHLRAAENMPEEMVAVLRSEPIRKGEGVVGGTAVGREPIQVPDTQDESYKGRLRDLVIRTGRRALLAVPLMHEERIVGALAVHRHTPGPFPAPVVDLLKTFATQSALAIQNAKLFREIDEKGKQLEVASEHKSQFLASMSHELRTPLNAILGFNEMMLDGLCGEVPAGFKDPLDETQKSGKHLLRLINNVLDLAKIEAGRMELALGDYSVHDTVESVRSTLRPLAAEKGLEFLANVPADIPLAYGDAGRITQCLMNLAGNSLKFTKEGRVEISVQQQNGQLRYCVADTGIGIPPEKIGSLFTEFKQTDATIASEYGGTGLGLSISKKFIEMHGGRIWVESEIGKGSAFIFEIPLKLGK